MQQHASVQDIAVGVTTSVDALRQNVVLFRGVRVALNVLENLAAVRICFIISTCVTHSFLKSLLHSFSVDTSLRHRDFMTLLGVCLVQVCVVFSQDNHVIYAVADFFWC